jgi:hypothetical protein
MLAANIVLMRFVGLADDELIVTFSPLPLVGGQVEVLVSVRVSKISLLYYKEEMKLPIYH